MDVFVGNLAHVSANIVLGLMGIVAVLARVGGGKFPREVYFGLLLTGLTFSAALVSQPPLMAVAYMSKLTVLVFVFYFAARHPRITVYVVAGVSSMLFVDGVIQSGYNKLNAIPIVEFSLFMPLLILSDRYKISPGVFRFTNLCIAALLFLQAVVLQSRGSILLCVLVAVLSLLPWQVLARVVSKLWMLPLVYIGVLVTLGFIFLSTNFDLLQPTKSNIDRTVMLSVLFRDLPNSVFGVSQADFSASVSTAVSVLDRKPYSEENLDPHSFLAYLFMYSGWLGIALLLFILHFSLKRICELGNQLPAVLFPLVAAMVAICVNPPSSWPRLKVICIFAVLIAVVRIRSSSRQRSFYSFPIRWVYPDRPDSQEHVL